MKYQGLVLLATLVTSGFEELKHPSEKKEHSHQEHYSILKPHIVNVYKISGRIQVVEINGAVLATKDLGFNNI
ncbi:MAG: hypothetical protein WBP16_16225 [Ferruginibacter sp.]